MLLGSGLDDREAFVFPCYEKLGIPTINVTGWIILVWQMQACHQRLLLIKQAKPRQRRLSQLQLDQENTEKSFAPIPEATLNRSTTGLIPQTFPE